jgi:NADP-dependent 3-hydroxy acid dehydrogenase YdfG
MNTLSVFEDRTDYFKGKRAVISGGTTGIGRATALQLARWGARVFIFGRHARELNDALEAIRKEGGNATGMVADQCAIQGVENVFETIAREWGGVDFLINNAAVSAETVEEMDLEEIDYAVRANLTGYITCTKLALQLMSAGAHIVNVGSMSAEKKGAGSEVYVATKAGNRGFSESLRRTLRDKGIKVSLIEPGLTGTDLLDVSIEEQREKEANGTMLKAEDIAISVAFCLAQPARCTVSAMHVEPKQKA